MWTLIENRQQAGKNHVRTVKKLANSEIESRVH